MARPNKIGLDYFNIDTDRYQDQKIKRLKNNYGGVGMAVYDYLLCEIYRDKGCYVPWNENIAFDVTDYFRTKETTVNEIVTYCGVVGLFDKAVLMRGMLTSNAIQKRYLLICKNAGRKDWDKLIPQEINLIGEEMEFITEESTQSKVKKKKENENEMKGEERERKEIRPLVFLTDLELKKLAEEFNTEDCNWMYDTLHAYKAAKGVEYKSDYGAICKWVKRALQENKAALKKENPPDSEDKIESALSAGEAVINHFKNLKNATHAPNTNY